MERRQRRKRPKCRVGSGLIVFLVMIDALLYDMICLRIQQADGPLQEWKPNDDPLYKSKTVLTSENVINFL